MITQQQNTHTHTHRRARTELGKIAKTAQEAKGAAEDEEAAAEEVSRGLGLAGARLRAEKEALQNADQLARVRAGLSQKPVKYGDVVQLEHRKSELFVAMHKTPGQVNPSSKRVSLKKGSAASHFRIMPRFKVRSIGSAVYAEDEIVLQSVKFDPMILGGTGNPKNRHPKADFRPEVGVRLPDILRHEPIYEVNGASEMRSFSVKMFGRYTEANMGALWLGLHKFRLFHPEGNAFVTASGDPDKGQVLDTADPAKRERTRCSGAAPAHVPYLKHYVGDASSPANFSAKSAWQFEAEDRSTTGSVMWMTPLRLRHVPSNKYLSVDSLRPARRLAERTATSLDDSAVDDGGGYSDDDADSAGLFTCALVEEVDAEAAPGALGSAESLVFYLVPTGAVNGKALGVSVTTALLEHRSEAAGSLYLLNAREPKPELDPMESTDDDAPAGVPVALAPQRLGSMREAKRRAQAMSGLTGSRLLFSTSKSTVDALKIVPLTQRESAAIDEMIGRRYLFKLYAFLAQVYDPSGAGAEPPPYLKLCEKLVSECLGLIDAFRKGAPPKRRHEAMAEHIKEANATLPAQFASFYTGEPNAWAQRIAVETKLLDAVFEAALAPYNRALHAARPFEEFAALTTAKKNENAEGPRALQKFLYVAVQRCMFDNQRAQEYFSSRSSRVWTASSPIPPSMMNGVAPPLSLARKAWGLWRNLLISQAEDALGATVSLGNLLQSSEAIVKKLVNNELFDRFKGLVVKCGPEPRLILLFKSLCFVENKPSFTNQEMCLRRLWMNLPDRYSFGVTFHEDPKAEAPAFGPVTSTSGLVSVGQHPRAAGKAPASYLGWRDDNAFDPVVAAWKAPAVAGGRWTPDCGSFWHAPQFLGIPMVGLMDTGAPDPKSPLAGGVGKLGTVCVEHLMWVLEPARLCEPCTGRAFTPFTDAKALLAKKMASAHGGLHQSKEELEAEEKDRARQASFKAHHQLASYVVMQFELMANMCRGRSYNCIAWLSRSFSYDLLLNMATNQRLPYRFRTVVVDFIITLFVDRFPQITNCGAPSLPEILWIYREEPNAVAGTKPKSMTPVIRARTLNDDDAFPAFFIPDTASIAGNPDPCLGHPDHFKFFLMRALTNSIVGSYGKGGRLVHELAAFNDFGGAAIRGQQALLDFGFQSTYVKLVDLVGANARLLDGRSDLDRAGKVFDPPENRYKISGAESGTVTRIKTEVIGLFSDIGNLRANYRLGKLLHTFKSQAEAGQQGKGKSGGGLGFLLGRTEADQLQLYESFESLFGPEGSDDAAKLDIAALGNKVDMDHALVDCVMYDDDRLMSAALRLLESTYGQRRELQEALAEVTLLEEVALPVYGDVHMLRVEMNELLYLVKTSATWGVKSRISGPFDDASFKLIMAIVDKLMTFLHTPQMTTALRPEAAKEKSKDGGSPGFKGKRAPASSTDSVALSEGLQMTGLGAVGSVDSVERAASDAAPCEGYFTETDLQGVTYECKNLWSLDVASKWRAKQGKPCAHHQTILRACNLQVVLEAAFALDNFMAWKGSICTVREKAESERRLTLVKRALLQLAKAFVRGNRENQEAVFGSLEKLHALATPDELAGDGDPDPILDARRAAIAAGEATADSSGPASDRPGGKGSGKVVARLAQRASALDLAGAWPMSCEALAQDVLMAVVESSEDLANRVPPTVIRFFAALTNMQPDVSAAPQLDFLFTMCFPDNRPHRPSQNLVASILLETKTYPRLASALRSVVPRAGGGAHPHHEPELAQPDRIVSLARAAVEGGNEHAANLISNSAGHTINATLDALTRLARQEADADADGDGGVVGVSGAHAVAALTAPLGEALLEYLAEQVLLLPVNADQLMHPSLWAFFETAGSPAFQALAGEKEAFSAKLLKCCEDLVDVTHRVVMALARLGLMEDIYSSPVREAVLAKVFEGVDRIMDNRATTDAALVKAFTDQMAMDCVTNGLAIKGFKTLMHRILPPKPGQSQEDLDQSYAMAFAAADVDGGGIVDIYEFEALFAQLNTTTLPSDMKSMKVKDSAGHKLHIRTVEECEAMVAVTRVSSAALGENVHHRGFTRQDRYGQRKISASAKESAKLFRRKVTEGMGQEKRQVLRPEATPSEHLEAFKRTVASNERIKMALQYFRFELVAVLERGVPAPPKRGTALKLPDGSDNVLSSAVEVKWPQVVERLVRYASEHYYAGLGQANFGDGVSTCSLILDTLHVHLIKARTQALDDDGNVVKLSRKASALRQVKPHDLEEDEFEAYRGKQEELNRLGVTTLAAKLVASVDDLASGGLPDNAIELLIELLNGGNREVQDTLYDYLTTEDTEGKFIDHLKRRLEASAVSLRVFKKRGYFGMAGGGGSVAPTEELSSACEETIQTARFLQLCCEGHHHRWQDLLREQPMYRASVNLVGVVSDIMSMLCESSLALSRFSELELDVVSQLMCLLTEVMQGPCAGNQEFIASSDVLVAVNSILPIMTQDFEVRKALEDPKHVTVRGLACVLLAACLEGRKDRECHEHMERRIETAALSQYLVEVERDIRALRKATANRPWTDGETQRLKALNASLVAIVTIDVELKEDAHDLLAGGGGGGDKDSSDDEDDDGGGRMAKKGKSKKKKTKKRKKKKQTLEEEAIAGDGELWQLVEIAWKGKVERTVFPVPREMAFVSKARKEEFLTDVDLASAEKRMAGLIREADDIVREAVYTRNLAESSAFYRLLHHRMPAFKISVYGLVVLLCLNVTFAGEELSSPLRSLSRFGTDKLDEYEELSVTVTLLLALLILACYAVIVAHLSRNEVPIVVEKLNEATKELAKDPTAKFTNPGAFWSSAFFAAVSLACCFVHFINYPAAVEWYLFVFYCQFPVIIASFRSYLVGPRSSAQRLFCIVYDSVVAMPFLRNHVALALCCVLGMNNTEYFTLMLLDVMNISSVAKDIMVSVTSPGKALTIVLYIFIITNIIFGAFGKANFPEAIRIPQLASAADDDAADDARRLLFAGGDAGGGVGGNLGPYDAGGSAVGSVLEGALRVLKSKTSSGKGTISTESYACENVFSCATFLFYQGISESGNMKSFMLPNDPRYPAYLPRIFFESTYFVWVGIILLNVITGLMVDTFGSIREEKNQRSEVLSTSCFVCGLSRDAYEDLGLKPGSPTFEAHINVDHNLWAYVSYLAYLNAKDPAELNGIESFVMGQVHDANLDWIPSRTSFTIEAQGKGTKMEHELEAAAALEAKADTEKLAQLLEAVAALQQQVKDLVEGGDDARAGRARDSSRSRGRPSILSPSGDF